ncbi:MAG: DUF4058 family protein [Isosphaeraceae bacterium]
MLRRGRRMPMVGRWPDSPYYLLVCRKQEAPRCTDWPAHFLRPLPSLSIPLAAPDPDITRRSSRSSKPPMLVRTTIATSTVAGRSIRRPAPLTPRGSRSGCGNCRSLGVFPLNIYARCAHLAIAGRSRLLQKHVLLRRCRRGLCPPICAAVGGGSVPRSVGCGYSALGAAQQ